MNDLGLMFGFAMDVLLVYFCKEVLALTLQPTDNLELPISAKR